MLQIASIDTTTTPSIEDLYTQYHAFILSFFTRHGFTYEDAEDLTQETFVKAWQALPTAYNDHLLSWLYCIAKHLAIDAARKQKARERNAPHCSLDGYEEMHADGCNQEESILNRLSLVEALQRLPQRHRRAVVFSAYGFSLSEIAELVSYSPTAIKSIVHRGSKTLKRHYQER